MAIPKVPITPRRRKSSRRTGGGEHFSGIPEPPPQYVPPQAKAIVAKAKAKAKAPPKPKTVKVPKPKKQDPNKLGPHHSNPTGTLPSTGGHVRNPYWKSVPKKQGTR